jgi:hypothetical protein
MAQERSGGPPNTGTHDEVSKVTRVVVPAAGLAVQPESLRIYGANEILRQADHGIDSGTILQFNSSIMAKKDHDNDREPKDKYEPGPKHGGPDRRHPGHEEEESGDDPKRHASIIERRWQGSPPPTAELYARALQQWQNLPGAVGNQPPDLTGAANKPAAPDAKPGPTTSAEEESES